MVKILREDKLKKIEIMPDEIENEAIIKKIIKNRVQLRVLVFLFISNRLFHKFQTFFNKLLEKTNSDLSINNKFDRSKIISYLQEDTNPISTFRAVEIIKMLERYKLLIPIKKDNNLIHYYEISIDISKNNSIFRPSYIADYLNEDLQSIISALKSLRHIPLKDQGIAVQLVKKRKNSKGWELLPRGEIIADKLSKNLGIDKFPFNYENKNGNNSIWDIFEEVCNTFLKLKQDISIFKQNLNQLQDFLNKIQSEISNVQWVSIERIAHFSDTVITKDYSEKVINTINAIKEDSKILLHFKTQIRILMSYIVEYSVIIRENLNKIKSQLESIRGVTSVDSFKENVENMKKNLENINIIVQLPDLSSITEDFSLNNNKKQFKCLEIHKINLSSIEELVIKALDYKYSLIKHLDFLKTQNISITDA